MLLKAMWRNTIRISNDDILSSWGWKPLDCRMFCFLWCPQSLYYGINQAAPSQMLVHPCVTCEYLHFWHLTLAGLGRDGIMLSRWLRINCCTSAGSESRCSLPNVTVVWTTTEGPISGDSGIKKKDTFERLLINIFLPLVLPIVPLAYESLRICSTTLFFQLQKHKE